MQHPFRNILFFVLLVNSGFGYAQSTVYIQNNTDLDFDISVSISGNKTITGNQWNALETISTAWENKAAIIDFDPDTVLVSGDTVVFDISASFSGDTVHLMAMFIGPSLGVNLQYAASASSFNHPWYSDGIFHEGQTTMDTTSCTIKYKRELDTLDNDDNIVFAIHKNFVYSILSSDFNDPNTINVMSYNVKLMPIITGDFFERASLLPALFSQNQDVVIFQEVFSDSARWNYLTPAMQAAGFANYTLILNDTALPGVTSLTNGGVIIYSKWPIVSEAEYRYNNCSDFNAQDCFATKGIKYAEIDKLGKTYHIFGTHMEAGGSALDVQIRIEQYGEMWNFIDSLNLPGTEAVIIGGDLNTGPKDGSEYTALKAALLPLIPDHIGYFESTFSYADTGNVIDHVWGSSRHLLPAEAYNSIITLRGIDSLMWDIADFSDHRTCLGRFSYPEITFNSIDTNLCLMDALTMSIASNFSLSYQWKLNSSAITGANATSYSIISATSGDNGVYDCSVTTDLFLGASSQVLTQWFFPNGPETFSKIRTYNVANVGIQDPCGVGLPEALSGDQEIRIYPTPSNGYLTLEIGELRLPLTIEIYNSIGQLEKRAEIVNYTTQINLGDSSPGLYYIWVKTAEFSVSEKLIIY